MIFNSLIFVLFFVVVLAVYWLLQPFQFRLKAQNLFLLIASYIFYGSWDFVFLGLIIGSTVINYLFAISIDRSKPKLAKTLLTIVIVFNFALLGYFKYYNFFSAELLKFLSMIGFEANYSILTKIILPVGISFFTFQISAYTIDVYRKRIKAETNFIDFALFICFFPQLVAGPIERAEDLLTEIKKERSITPIEIEKAVWNLLHGFFLKVVVADNLAPLIDGFYGDRMTYLLNPPTQSPFGIAEVLFNGFAFTVQVYGDFAGYSIIALGVSGLLGIPLTRNFIQPFFATNPGEYWKRWHTTLIRWFTDYLYKPLGGSRVSKPMHLRNVFIVFAVSGLWHGANWTYIIWGVLNGLYVTIYKWLFEDFARNKGKWVNIAGVISTVILISLSMVFFRAYSLNQVIFLFTGAFQSFSSSGLSSQYELINYIPTVFNIVWPVFVFDALSRFYKDDHWIVNRHLAVKIFVQLYVFLMIIFKGQFGKEVIYFAF